jgi:hypothetical protein
VSDSTVRRQLKLPRDPKPVRAATAGRAGRAKRPERTRRRTTAKRSTPRTSAALPTKSRLFAHPARPAARRAGGARQLAPADYAPAADDLPSFDSKRFVARPLRKGARIIGGTILGRIGPSSGRLAPTCASRSARGPEDAAIDPKPILDGWKLLESTAIYRRRGATRCSVRAPTRPRSARSC